MEINRRVITYVAICYLVISVLLFSTFIYSYRYYFYKNQKQTVILRTQAKEELFLKSIVEKVKSHFRTKESEKNLVLDSLKREAKAKLVVVSEALKVISEEKTNKPEPINQDIDDPDFIFSDVPEKEKTITRILKPLNKKDSEGVFIKMFDRLNLSSDTKRIRIQKAVEGEFNKPIPISYLMLGEENLNLYNDGFNYKWRLKAFGEIPRVESVDYNKVRDEIKVLDAYRSKRLVIFESNNPVPIYSGQDKVIEFEKIETIWSRAIEKAEDFYFTENFENEVIYKDERMEKVQMHSILIDPELKLTMALTRDIFESEWKQYSFFDRNIYPISVYIILAWVVCPILAWFAYIMAARFRFNYTVELDNRDHYDEDSDDRYENELKAAKTQSFLTSPIPDWEGEESEEINLPKTVEKGKNEQNTLFSQVAKNVEKHDGNDSSGAKIGPFENFSGKELKKIRENNIRKSKGVFNASQNNDDEIDYLEGVKSDVLKSLISKMREGN